MPGWMVRTMQINIQTPSFPSLTFRWKVHGSFARRCCCAIFSYPYFESGKHCVCVIIYQFCFSLASAKVLVLNTSCSSITPASRYNWDFARRLNALHGHYSSVWMCLWCPELCHAETVHTLSCVSITLCETIRRGHYLWFCVIRIRPESLVVCARFYGYYRDSGGKLHWIRITFTVEWLNGIVHCSSTFS